MRFETATYLGDGVYASTTGYGIELATNDPDKPSAWIFLEPAVLDALDKYRLRLAKSKPEETCKSCKHDGNQNKYPSGCTGCSPDDDFLRYEPAQEES